MSDSCRTILVTSALPYANGPLHLGHLVEHVQTDIWVRFQRARGHQCYYVCADDAHGTPIMIRARQEGITPEELIARMQQEHERDLAEFAMSYDNYYTTHSPENRGHAEYIYEQLAQRGQIFVKTVRQAFDEQEQMFLPDRFIRGQCPRCGAEDQYGDNCEKCGATYAPTELKNAVSVLSGQPPVEKDSEHHFFDLAQSGDMLKQWMATPGVVQPEIANKLDEWFEAGLQAWDISRDAPYFGFEIPGAKGKYFYVWLDAPIGYMSSFKHLCAHSELDFDAFWQAGSEHELYHFIGKDIVYFHALFWPAMLAGAGFRKPSAIFAHGFLTVNGHKMSKSRGTFIMARTYLDHLDPEYLRYYYAAKLNGRVEDIDLNLEDFALRVNADLVGKVVNIASRCAGFITKRFDGKLAPALPQPELFQQFLDAGESIAAAYEAREFSRAIREIMALADVANQYIDQEKPWVIAKQEGREADLHAVCTQGLNLFQVLMAYLQPVLPIMTSKVLRFFRLESLAWRPEPLLDREIEKFQPLMTRLDPARIEKMVEAAKQTAAVATPATAPSSQPAMEPIAPEISYEDFRKTDLRVARIVQAEAVPKADKLLKLTLDVGEEKPRTVFAGIKDAYPQPEMLNNRLTVMVANLAPRKMKFGVSEGMVLAAGPGKKELWILSPDDGARPGMQVK